MTNLYQTPHFNSRMKQRGITKVMIDFTLAHGDIDGDKFVTHRENLKREICELDLYIHNLQQQRKTAMRLMDKGGISVIADNGRLITTYNTDSYLSY